MEKKYRVALYCRVASADQLALEMQRDSLVSYAVDSGFEKDTFKIYTDNGYSGLNFDRPAFSEMERDIGAGIIGAVIVLDISRIGRTLEMWKWIARLRDKRIAFVSSDMPFNEVFFHNRYCFDNLIKERYQL